MCTLRSPLASAPGTTDHPGQLRHSSPESLACIQRVYVALSDFTCLFCSLTERTIVLFTLTFSSGRFSSSVGSSGSLVSFTEVVSSSVALSDKLTWLAEYALKLEHFSPSCTKFENLKPGFWSCSSLDMAV